MATIRRSEIIDKLVKGLRLDSARDKIPQELASKIIPTFNLEETKEIQVKRAVFSDNGGGTILTTSNKKRTFLVGVSLSVTKDVVNAGILSNINIYPKGGANTQIIELRYEPTIAGQFIHSISLPFPIELEKNTAIGLVNGSGVASIDSVGIVQYYELDE